MVLDWKDIKIKNMVIFQLDKCLVSVPNASYHGCDSIGFLKTTIRINDTSQMRDRMQGTKCPITCYIADSALNGTHQKTFI